MNKLKEFSEKLKEFSEKLKDFFLKTQGFANSTWFLLPKNVQKISLLRSTGNLKLLAAFGFLHDRCKLNKEWYLIFHFRGILEHIRDHKASGEINDLSNHALLTTQNQRF